MTAETPSRTRALQRAALLVFGLAGLLALLPRDPGEPSPPALPGAAPSAPAPRLEPAPSPGSVAPTSSRASPGREVSPAPAASGSASQAAGLAPLASVTTGSATAAVTTTLVIRGRTLDASGSPLAGAEVSVGVGANVEREALESLGWPVQDAKLALPPGAPTVFFGDGALEAYGRGLLRHDRRELATVLATGRSRDDGWFEVSVASVASDAYPTLLVRARLERAGEVLVCRETSTAYFFDDSAPEAVDDLVLLRCPRLRVVVRDRGRPVAGAWVLEDFDGKALLRTGEDGAVVDHPACRNGWISVFAAGFGADHYTVEPVAGADWDVTVELSPAAQISGRVLAPGGTPVPRVLVTADEVYPGKGDDRDQDPACPVCRELAAGPGVRHSHGSAASAHTETDAEGSFVLEGLASGRRHRVWIHSHADRTCLPQTVESLAPAHDLVVTLARAGRLVVDPRLPEGFFATDEAREAARERLAERSCVHAYRLETTAASPGWSSSIDPERGEPGAVSFPCLAPGVYRVTAERVDRGLAFAVSEPVEVFAGEESRVALALAPGRKVEGRVQSAGVKPDELRVVLESPFGNNYAAPYANPEEDGAFALEGLPLGEATLLIVRRHGEVLGRVAVPAGVSRVEVSLEAKPGPK